MDSIIMWRIRKPEWLDVIVASNPVGGIFTGLGSMLQGGMGGSATTAERGKAVTDALFAG